MAKHIAPEEEWLRLLVLELTPVLGLMRDNDLPTSKDCLVLFAARLFMRPPAQRQTLISVLGLLSTHDLGVLCPSPCSFHCQECALSVYGQTALDFAGSQAVLRAVADRAMQVSDEAVLTFRSHRSSRLQNASLLAAAVRLQALVAKCASGADCTDMAGLFEELLTSAAQQRFRSLLSKQAAATGRPLRHDVSAEVGI